MVSLPSCDGEQQEEDYEQGDFVDGDDSKEKFLEKIYW